MSMAFLYIILDLRVHVWRKAGKQGEGIDHADPE